MSLLAFMSLGFTEMLVVGVVALLVFGGRLPEVMRNLGRAYGKFRQGMHDATSPLRQELRRLDLRTPDRTLPTASGEPPPYAPEPAPSTPDAPEDPGAEPEHERLSNGEDANGVDAAQDPDPSTSSATKPFPSRSPPTRRARGVADEPPPV